jgi:hypothetical protein
MGLVKRKQKFSTIAIAFFAMEIASIEIAFAKDKPPAPPVDVSKIDATKPGPPLNQFRCRIRTQAVRKIVRPRRNRHIQRTRVDTTEDNYERSPE